MNLWRKVCEKRRFIAVTGIITAAVMAATVGVSSSYPPQTAIVGIGFSAVELFVWITIISNALNPAF